MTYANQPRIDQALVARDEAMQARAAAEAAALATEALLPTERDERAAGDAAVLAQVNALQAAVPSMSPVQSVAGQTGAIQDQPLREALNIRVFPSRAAAASTAIPAYVTAITTTGFTFVDLRGGAAYQRAANQAAPLTPGGFRDIGGTAWEIVGEELNPYQFGAQGLGADDRAPITEWWAAIHMTATSFGAQYPSNRMRTGFVPPTRFAAIGETLQLVSYSTGVTVRGCGPASMLDNIEIHCGGNRASVNNVWFVGASAWGFRAFGARRRFGSFKNLMARNKLYGLAFEGPGGGDALADSKTEQCTAGFLIGDTLDMHVADCTFYQPVASISGLPGGMGGVGFRQLAGGQLKTSNVAAAGIRASMLVTGSTRRQSYECYHSNLSLAGLTGGRLRALPILGITNNGSGRARLQTSLSWTLASIADRGGRFLTRTPQAATVTISGAAGSIISVKAGFAEILSIAVDVPPPVAYAGSAAATAAAVAAAIRAGSGVHGWAAFANGADLTVLATDPYRPMDNLRLEVTGTGGMASPVAAFGAITHGDSVVEISTQSTTGTLASVLAGGVDILGAPVAWNEGGTTSAANLTAAAVATQINAGTSTHGYGAYAIDNHCYLIAPLADGDAAQWRTVVPTVTGGLRATTPSYAAITMASAADFARGQTIGVSGSTGGYDGHAEVVHVESSTVACIQHYVVGTVSTAGFAYHPNRLIDGDKNLSISTGVSAYDGSVDIEAAGETWVDVSRDYTVNATGTLNAYNWDLEVIIADGAVRSNDFFFTGGNINYMYLGSCYNWSFGNTRYKSKVWAEPQINQSLHINRISFSGSGRGRDADALIDVKIGGAIKGWSTEGYRDDSNSSNAGNGYRASVLPDSTGGWLNNRAARLTSSRVKEGGVIEHVVGGNTAQLLANEYTLFGHRIRKPSNVTSPVNGIDIISGGSGSGVGVNARGEADVLLSLAAAGGADVQVCSASGASRSLRIRPATGQPTNPNHVVVQAAASGSPATIQASEGPLQIGTAGSTVRFLGAPRPPSATRQTLQSSTGSLGEFYISNPEAGKSNKVIDVSGGWRYVGDNSVVSLV